MKSLIASLKSFKPAHWLYNLLHIKSLRHNKKAYKDYKVLKPLFASLSSKDFGDKNSQAWLDIGHSRELAPSKSEFSLFSEPIQQQILQWSDNGFMQLKGFFDDSTVNAINSEIEKIADNKLIEITHDNKFQFASRFSETIKKVTQTPELIRILNFILDKEVVPFQTLNFVKGSGQRAHSDSIHMTTYPLGYLIAVWIALEDIHPDSGPLFYYPGSHRLPYLLNSEFNEKGSKLKLGKNDYSVYEDLIGSTIEKRKLEKQVFLPKKGDILIWHANLIHGGMPVTNPELTRKSMVIHYYARDVIKYHEITERPSLLVE